ncbi:hypothetical protein COF37_02370 [Bacillus wiedmannii]|nr:hypothetical protein COF37_02370 [Bacillus wiedmannii]
MPCDSKRAAFALNCIQLQRLECSVASLFPARQKAPLRQKLHPPHILNEPLPLLAVTQPSVFLLHPVHPSTLYSVSQG